MLRFYVQVFGYLTFSTITLLLVWKVIAEPQIEMNRLSFVALQEMQAKQSEALNTTLRITAEIVRISENLKETSENMKSVTEVTVQEHRRVVEGKP